MSAAYPPNAIPAAAAASSVAPRPRTRPRDARRPSAEAAARAPAGRTILAPPAKASTPQAARNGPAAAVAIAGLCTEPVLLRYDGAGAAGCWDAFASLRPVSADLRDPLPELVPGSRVGHAGSG